MRLSAAVVRALYWPGTDGGPTEKHPIGQARKAPAAAQVPGTHSMGCGGSVAGDRTQQPRHEM